MWLDKQFVCMYGFLVFHKNQIFREDLNKKLQVFCDIHDYGGSKIPTFL